MLAFIIDGMSVLHEKEGFANRLNEALTDSAYPVKGENRQAIVGKIFGVTQKAARKWLEGEGMPTLERCIFIAKQLEVQFEWLMTGRGTKHHTRITIEKDLSNHHVTDFQHKLVCELFDGLIKHQQMELIKQMESIVDTNKKIYRELQEKEQNKTDE